MTYVKICGLTSLDDALTALEFGADYLGFIFYEQSPRAMTPAQVESIIDGLPADRKALTVGVFIDTPHATIEEYRTRCQLDLIQLHGTESPAMVAAIRRAYKAVRPATLADWDAVEQRYLSHVGAPHDPDDIIPDLLIDAYHPTQQGGTGLSVDRMIAGAAASLTNRLMLAGGLTPTHVAEAILEIKPFAVDVSSGVESATRRKDHRKVQAFIQAVRQADFVLSHS